MHIAQTYLQFGGTLYKPLESICGVYVNRIYVEPMYSEFYIIMAGYIRVEAHIIIKSVQKRTAHIQSLRDRTDFHRM